MNRSKGIFITVMITDTPPVFYNKIYACIKILYIYKEEKLFCIEGIEVTTGAILKFTYNLFIEYKAHLNVFTQD